MIRKKKISKRIIYILSMFFILLAGYVIIEYQEGKREALEKKNQISEKVLSDKRYNQIRLNKIHMIEADGGFSLNAEAENEGSKTYLEENVSLTFLDQKGKVVCSSNTVIPTIEPKAQATVYASIDKKCKSAYTFVIEKIEEGNSEYE